MIKRVIKWVIKQTTLFLFYMSFVLIKKSESGSSSKKIGLKVSNLENIFLLFQIAWL